MATKKPFSKDIIHLHDPQQLCDQIIKYLKKEVLNSLSRRGGVVGISGGIDSSVTLALTAQAFGKKRTLGIMLPEKDSSPDSLELAKILADKFEVEKNTNNAMPKKAAKIPLISILYSFSSSQFLFGGDDLFTLC